MRISIVPSNLGHGVSHEGIVCSRFCVHVGETPLGTGSEGGRPFEVVLVSHPGRKWSRGCGRLMTSSITMSAPLKAADRERRRFKDAVAR